MKFILILDDGGYQVRYWDQINDQIGESIATNWDKDKLYKTLRSKNFNIDKSNLYRAIDKIDENQEPFVVLKSKFKKNIDLDTFMNNQFFIDE